MAQRLKTDWTLFGTTIGMVAFGAVILYSASSVIAELKFGSSWHFVLRQGHVAGALAPADDVPQAHSTTASCRIRPWPSPPSEWC